MLNTVISFAKWFNQLITIGASPAFEGKWIFPFIIFMIFYEWLDSNRSLLVTQIEFSSFFEKWLELSRGAKTRGMGEYPPNNLTASPSIIWLWSAFER